MRLKWNICLVYLDDILIFSNKFETHVERLRQVFQALSDSNLKLKPSKCSFKQETILFLGHIISNEGIRPDPSKVEKVKNFKPPKTLKQLLSF